MPASVNQDEVFAELRALILGVITGVQVVRGFQNRVSMPKEPFICLSEAPSANARLSTNTHTYTDPSVPGATDGSVTLEQSTQFNIQVDCYGPLAGDWAATITTVLRDSYATAMMVKCQPLYATDPLQMTLVDGESQYELRFTFNAVLQYNPSVTVPMLFAEELGPISINIGEAA